MVTLPNRIRLPAMTVHTSEQLIREPFAKTDFPPGLCWAPLFSSSFFSGPQLPDRIPFAHDFFWSCHGRLIGRSSLVLKVIWSE